MMFQKLALLACLGVSSVSAFSLQRPSSAKSFASSTRCPSTCLYSEGASADSGAGESPAVDDAAPDDGGNDILNSPAFLNRKIDVLKTDIAKIDEDIAAATTSVEEGKAEWQEQFDALSREYDNMSARLNEQSKAGDADATIQVARELCTVLDNFDRAFGVVEAETDEEKGIEVAYKNVYQMILDGFKELGITEIETLGKEFDYEVHQAVMQRPSDDYEEGLVCDELQKGFTLGDRLIRAAMVSVAA